jgi:hypothetical protein
MPEQRPVRSSTVSCGINTALAPGILIAICSGVKNHFFFLGNPEALSGSPSDSPAAAHIIFKRFFCSFLINFSEPSHPILFEIIRGDGLGGLPDFYHRRNR